MHEHAQFATVLGTMSGELKRVLIDRPVTHMIPCFKLIIVPVFIGQHCTFTLVVAPIRFLAVMGTIAYKTTAIATLHLRNLVLAPAMADRSLSIPFFWRV